MTIHTKSTASRLYLSLSLISYLVAIPSFADKSVIINIKGNLIMNPPCEITGPGNKPVQIDFSDMVIRKITGSNYGQPVNYTLTCDASDSTQVALTFKGVAVTLNKQSVLKTSNTNLGIRFAKGAVSNPTFVALNNEQILFTNKDRPTLSAFPIINSAVATTSIAPGAFDASATLEASYP